jgi:hypothetical protein
MKNIRKNIFLILLILSLPNCKWLKIIGTPYYSLFSFKIPDGTPSFKKGYADGCATVLASRGNSMMRQRYGGFHYDADMIGNPEYRFGYSRGISWCFQTTVGPNNLTSPDRYLAHYGNNTTFEMGAGSINNAWGGLFGGSEGKAMGESIGGSGLDGVMGSVGSGGSGGVFSGNPLWAGGSGGQFFGQ